MGRDWRQIDHPYNAVLYDEICQINDPYRLTGNIG